MSQLGTAVTSVALPLAAVIKLHATAFQVGILSAAGTAAWLLFGLISGVWADRLPHRPLLVACDLVRGAALLSIPLASAAGVLTLRQLVVAAFVVGVGTVFFDVAFQPYMAAVIDPARLLLANSRMQVGGEVARVSGPALGGVLVQAFGAPTALLADVASYVVSALFLRGTGKAVTRQEPPGPQQPGPQQPGPQQPGPQPRGQFAQVGEGLRFVWANPVLRPLALTASSLNMCESGLMALQVVFLVHAVHLRAGFVGALIATDAAGAVLGALVVGRLSSRLGNARAVSIAATAGPVVSLLIPLTSQGMALAFFAVGTAGLAMFTVVFSIVARVYRQTTVPARLLGRVTAVNRFISWGVLPIGALLAGALGSAIGSRGALWVITAVMVVLTPLPVLLSPVRRVRDLASVPVPPDGSTSEPTASGPVVHVASDPPQPQPPQQQPPRLGVQHEGTKDEH